MDKFNLREFLERGIQEDTESDNSDIIKYVEDNSSFTLAQEPDEDYLMFQTRENGNVGDETHSNIDYKEGEQLIKYLENNFRDYEFSIDTVDEWVHIDVDMREKGDVFKYKFKKDFEGSGFTKTFHSMEDLIERYGDWVEVDWDSITDKVENIDSFPNNIFAGSHDSSPLLISKRGDKGNTWGYNFYIIKNKETD